MGVRTAWLEAGPPDAPPVVLLHGLGATNASMLPLLGDLARDHRVLAPDAPGFGASEAPALPVQLAPGTPPGSRPSRPGRGSRGAVLVGNSMGGRVALEAGLAHPSLGPRPRAARPLAGVPPAAPVRPGRAAAQPAARPGCRCPALSHRLVVEALRGMMSVPDRLPQAWYDAAADEAVRVFRSPAHRVAFFSVRPADLPGGGARPARLLGPPARAAAAGAVPLGRPRPAGARLVRPARRRRAAARRLDRAWRTAGTCRSSSTPWRPAALVRGFLDTL